MANLPRRINLNPGKAVIRKADPLKIRVYTTFAAKWLIPRLPSFYVTYPNIRLNISNVVAPIDFQKDKVDLAIQFGTGNWPGVETELLFTDVIQPVCSPKLLKHARLVELDDLRKVQLLHSHYRRADWPDWLMAVKRPDLLTDAGVNFPSSVLTYQAALEGVGVAVASFSCCGMKFMMEHWYRCSMHPSNAAWHITSLGQRIVHSAARRVVSSIG